MSFFGASFWQIRFPENQTDVEAVYYEFYDPLNVITVIAVRGASVSHLTVVIGLLVSIPVNVCLNVNVKCLQADSSPVKVAVMWLEAAICQFTLYMLPGFSFVPDIEVFRLMKAFEWLESLFTVSTPFWDPIADRIQELSADMPVVVVGHGFGECLCVMMMCDVCDHV